MKNNEKLASLIKNLERIKTLVDGGHTTLLVNEERYGNLQDTFCRGLGTIKKISLGEALQNGEISNLWRLQEILDDRIDPYVPRLRTLFVGQLIEHSEGEAVRQAYHDDIPQTATQLSSLIREVEISLNWPKGPPASYEFTPVWGLT